MRCQGRPATVPRTIGMSDRRRQQTADISHRFAVSPEALRRAIGRPSLYRNVAAPKRMRAQQGFTSRGASYLFP